MDCIEKLMAEYPDLKYSFRYDMPDKLSGLTINNNIYINGNNTYTTQVEVLAEELGHYETSVGNVIDEDPILHNKQEREARDWGYRKLVSPDGLIACWENGIDNIYDVADFFEVSVPYLLKCINMYRRKFGIQFDFCNYHFDLSNGVRISKFDQ